MLKLDGAEVRKITPVVLPRFVRPLVLPVMADGFKMTFLKLCPNVRPISERKRQRRGPVRADSMLQLSRRVKAGPDSIGGGATCRTDSRLVATRLAYL